MITKHTAELCEIFGLDTTGEPFGNGHINDTTLAKKGKQSYVLQKINTNVFKNPDEMMDNIFSVTEHLRQKINEAGGDCERETLHFISTKDGKPYYRADDGACFRMYKLVDRSIAYEESPAPMQFYGAARAFGRFQNMLADFPADKLYETIPHFHDTPSRLAALRKAVEEDVCGRLESCREEVDYALLQADETGIVSEEMKKGTVPCRVTHNDTKLNNVLFDTETEKAICVIDLDTVMPGSLLYDFGDALRYGANTAAEDETDLDKVTFDLELFKAFAKGFLEEVKDSMTEKEIELLPFSAKLMTFECGIRFLTDYLNGDTYFKIKYDTHNLDRARNQLKLCRDIDAKRPEMEQIIKELF